MTEVTSRSVRRREDPRLLTGRGNYAADGKANQKLDETLARRLMDMDAFFDRGRSGLAANYVQDLDPYGHP